MYILTHDKFGKDTQHKDELKKGDSYNVFKQLRIVLSSPDCQPFISWLPSGNSLCINHKDKFVKNVLFRYFGETEFKVFMKSMKNKGFKRVKVNDFVGDAVYSHELFQIGRPELCAHFTRGEIPPMKKIAQKKRELSSAHNVVGGVAVGDEALQKQEEEKPSSEPNVADRMTLRDDATQAVVAAIESQTKCAAKSPSQVAQVDAASEEGMISRMNSTNSMLMQKHFMNPSAMGNASDLDRRYFAALYAMRNTAGMNASHQQMMHLPTGHPLFASSPFAQQGMQSQTTNPSADNRQIDSMALQQHMAQITGQSNFNASLFNAPVARRQSDSVDLQQQMAQNLISGKSNYDASLFNAPVARRQSDSMASYHQQVSQNSMKNDSNQESMHFHHPAIGNNSQQLDETAAAASQSNKSPQSAQDLRLAMLKVDSELLKVKEMKLLKMQQQLKMRLEMNGDD